MPVMARQVARFQARWNAQGGSVPLIWRLSVRQRRIRQRPQRGGRYPSQQSAEKRSAVIGAGCNARNVRAIKTDIGQFAIAKLGQFADIALIVPERLDHADEREQHGSLLVSTIQLLEEASIVEMNIGQDFSFQKIKWC